MVSRITALSYWAPLAWALCSVLSSLGQGQTQPGSRIRQPIEDHVRVALKGNVHPLAHPRFDMGAVADSFAVARMLLLLQRSPEKESALQQFLLDVHRPSNPDFHHWLTPPEFAARYGPQDAEVAAVSGWLQQHGFSVDRVTPGKTAIEFSGTAAQVREAFHTEIHDYLVNGEHHYANNKDPQIPAALAPVIAGLTPMNDFRPKSYIQLLGKAVYDSSTHKLVPNWTFPAGQDALDLGPGDFALQYDLTPLYSAGITGKGVTIGIIGASNIDPNLVATYRSFFGLPANPLKVVIDGSDPGENQAAGESYLDVELSGAAAPEATIILYTAADTSVQSGLYLAAQRAVDDDQAPILSTSYGLCEQDLGSAGNQFWYSLWEQAAAQGQTSFVSAGDGGPAGCDNFNNQQPAQYGIAMNGFGSTPWNVSVGGTDFYYSSYNQDPATQQTQLETYWDTVATIFPTTSILQPVPEQAWNDSFGLNLVNGGIYNPSIPDIIAGSGGPSNCVTGTDAADGTYSSCSAGYPKPSWQTGKGVPRDGVRDVPDLSLFAAAGENDSFYPFCTQPGDCAVSQGDLSISVAGGTSASSPSMAGILALIEQKYGSQGQADYIFYPLAAQHPAAFHDITTGSNVVPCQQGTPNCNLSTATDNTKGVYTFGYYARPGYDVATGLGSVDAALLFNYWNSLSFGPTSTKLSLSQTSFTHGTPVTVNVGVTGSGGIPTGGIAFVTTASQQDNIGLSPLTLQNGSAKASVNSLPGGQYKITGRYSGDNLFASSVSNPVAVDIAPENSTVSLSGNTYAYGATSYTPLTNGSSYPYGTYIAIDAQPLGVNAASGTSDGIAAGTVNFTDTAAAGNSTSGPLSLNVAGTAEWVPASGFAVGAHTVSASYSGDRSFNASSSSALLNFTIAKTPPAIGLEVNQNLGNVTVGYASPVTLMIVVGITGLAEPPTGTASFYLGNQSLGTATLAPTNYNQSVAVASITVSNLPLGVNSLTASYSGDSNYNAGTSNPVQVTVTQQQPTAGLTAMPNATSMLPTQDLTVTADVTGVSGLPAPTGYVDFYADGPGGSYSGSCTLVNGSCSMDFGSSYWSPGTVTVNVGYSGDSTYAPSNMVIPVTMLNMFTITAASSVSFAAGATTGNTAALTITPANGFTGPVYFACTIAYYPPGAKDLPTCSVPVSVKIPSTAAVSSAMTISSVGPTTVSQAEGTKDPRWLAAQSLIFIAGIFVLGFPLRRRVRLQGTTVLLVIVLAGSMVAVSCGGGGSAGVGGGGHTVPGTTPGIYKFMVDGAYTQNVSSTGQPLFYSTPQVFIVNAAIQ